MSISECQDLIWQSLQASSFVLPRASQSTCYCDVQSGVPGNNIPRTRPEMNDLSKRSSRHDTSYGVFSHGSSYMQRHVSVHLITSMAVYSTCGTRHIPASVSIAMMHALPQPQTGVQPGFDDNRNACRHRGSSYCCDQLFKHSQFVLVIR